VSKAIIISVKTKELKNSQDFKAKKRPLQ